MRKGLLLILIFLMTFTTGNAQLFHKNVARKAEKKLFGSALDQKKEGIAKEPRKVLKAKKIQEANKRKLNNSYKKSVLLSQKRTIEIQTPEVQTRMKQDQKDNARRDKEKKRKVRSGTKKARKKYN